MDRESRKIALFFAEVLNEKKAEETIILDIQKISDIADYFVISTAQSSNHLKTLSNTILEKIKEKNINRNLNYEGHPQTGWVLMDCGDVVIHLFLAEKRDYYRLENIWNEAERILLDKQKEELAESI